MKKNKPEKEKTSLGREILSWIEVLVVAGVLAWLINSFILINATVPSGSMKDTIHEGNRLFGLRLTYLFHEPERGDIVVFHYPVDDALGIKKNYIKRIIGLPGETVEIRDAQVYIDGEQLEEDYLKDEEWIYANTGMSFEVPEDCYFMMGDNRNNSLDGRYWAGEAVRRADEFASAGVELTKETALALSFVRKDQILGKAYVRYWPLTQISVLH